MKNLFPVLLITFALAACNEGLFKSSEPTSPPTAVSVNIDVLDLAKQGKPIDALKLGENFLRSGSDPEGVLHATLARIYAEVGDTDSSVRHLQKANGVAGNTNMTVIVGQESHSAPLTPPIPTPSVSAGVARNNETGGASAVIGPHGIEVRAGGASASVRN